jgi:mono/diheme cytochrome c family protein
MNHKFNKIRQILVAFVLLAAVTGISSCEKYSYSQPAVDPNTTLLFQTDIQPIFSSNCVTCHGGAIAPDLRDGKSYMALTRGGFVTVPAETSKLYSRMSATDHSARSTQVDKLKVLYWITQGALNN